MTQLPSIEAVDLTLRLPIHGWTAPKSLKSNVALGVGGRREKDKRGRMHIVVLDKLAFQINPGDRIGFVGRNGAGKSTLLKTLAGIYRPTSGSVKINGNISALFSKSLGFNSDATGMENILLYNTLMGIPKAEQESLVPEIADFSELGDFLYMPLRTYSAGMTMRLGFALSTAVKADILLIDEVFGAGDRHFQLKAQQRIERTMSESNTMVMASHSDQVISQFCNKALWLHGGCIRAFGPTDDVLKEYNDSED